MDGSHPRNNQHHYHQNAIRWPTECMRNWMHCRNRKVQLEQALPPPISVPAEARRTLSSSSSSSNSVIGGTRGGAYAPTFSSSAMKANTIRSSSAPKTSSPNLINYTSRRHCSPCRKLQQRNPQPRRICQPGPTPSPDLLLADKAEWKRTLHDTTYRTYKALPRSNRSFNLEDYALLREILALAENLTQPEGAEVRLVDLLKAYDMVLQKHAMNPTEDTFYYRMLLKLSLSYEKDWWKRLNREIVKNDVRMKVNSFRNHKLLLSYWLLWRCHHQKGARQEKGSKKGCFMEGETPKSCHGPAVSQEVKQPVGILLVGQNNIENALENQVSTPFYRGDLPLQDTVLVMDVVDVPVHASKTFKDFDSQGVSIAFQAWQRLTRQRKKKRCIRGRNTHLWNQAVSFHRRNTLARMWTHLRHFTSERTIEIKLWHENFVQSRYLSLWRRNCRLTKEMCKAGKMLWERKLCLSVLSKWRNHQSSLNMISEDYFMWQMFRRWRTALAFRKHSAQIVEQRLFLTLKRIMILWRSRLHAEMKHKMEILHFQKRHQIRIRHSCMQGWRDLYNKRVKLCRQRVIFQQRLQTCALRKWLVWAQSKHALKEVLSAALSSRARYVQNLCFSIWLSWWRMNQIIESKILDILIERKKRMLSKTLCTWEAQTSKRKWIKDSLQRALHNYTLQLYRKSLNGWKSWITKNGDKGHLIVTIMELVCDRQCRKILLQWKMLTSCKRRQEKRFQSLESYYRTRIKAKYWTIWYQQSRYQAAIIKCCAQRNRREAVRILNALRSFAKISSSKPKKHDLAQDIEAYAEVPISQTDQPDVRMQNSRKYQMKDLLFASKELIRKGKHFAEVRQMKGRNRAPLVKYWSKFWARTALDGWKIIMEKKKLEKKLLHLPRELFIEEANKLMLSENRVLEYNHNNIDAERWRHVLLKLSIEAWIHFHAIKREQRKIEIFYILRLKNWWVSGILHKWRTIAQKYLKEKGKLYQTGYLMQVTESEDSLVKSEVAALSTNPPICLQRLQHSDENIEKDKSKLFFRSLRNYTVRIKAERTLQRLHRSSLLQWLWQQWKLATLKAVRDKECLCLIVGRLRESPERYRIIETFLEESPRWILHKGLQVWKTWKIFKATKRSKNRKAWEHLAGILQAKAFASFHFAISRAMTLKMSIHHFQICYQLKTFLAWKKFTAEHVIKNSSKLKAVIYHRNRTEMIVLRKWCSYSQMSQMEDLFKDKAYVFWRDSTLKKYLKAWIELFLKCKTKHQYLLWIKIRMDLHCLHKVLCAWRHSSQRRIQQQIHIDSIQENRRMVCLYQRFHVWVWYIHRKKCVRAAQEMHRRLHLRFFFQSWNHKIAQLKFKQKANETVRNHIMNKFCRMAFLIWRDLTVMARHARNAQWIAVNKIHQQRMTWIFSKWRDVVRTMNFINEVLESATLRSKKKIFIKWIGIVKMQRKIEEIQVCVSSMKRERWLRLLFQWWLHRSFELKKEREGSTAAMIFARSFMLSRVLQRFKQWMHDRQMKEGFSMLASGKLQHVYMKRAFDGWVKHVENRIRKDIACQKLQQISNHYLLAKYFSIIQEIVAANGYLRRTVIEALQVNVTTMKLNKVILWRQQRYRLSLLQQWHKRTISSMMVRDIKKQFSLNVLRRGFYDWKLYVESKERLNTLVIRLSIYHAAFLRRKYWLQWQFQAEKALYQQQFLLFKTLKAWSKYSKMKLFRRYLEHNATSMILQSLQKRILWGWQSYVREISIRREEHQQQRFLEREAKGLAKRTERRQKIEFLSSVFRAWKERFQHVTSILMFLDKKNSQLKRSVWVFWTSWASLSGRARRLRQQWIRSILHSGLNAWRNACTLRICQSKEREAEAARFASWKFLSFVWPRWKSYVAHGRKRAEALQYCLSLIQTIQESNLLRGIIRAWKDYALERGKRREHSWAAEATYKRHKLADYLTAWHDYTAASKESASSLKGTIQVYKGSNHRVHSLANSMYRFHQAFGMIPNFGVHTTCFHDIGAPAVVIEEVSSPVEESQGAIIAHPSHWSSSQEIELNDEAQDLPRLTSNNEDYFQSQGDPSLNKSNLIEYLGLEIEDDVDDWSLNDTDINASN